MFKHKIPIHRPKPHIRKPRMYLDTNRECSRCGSNKTYDKIINRIQWHRDVDENGKWTGNWICNKCYHKEYIEKHNHENDLMREMMIKMRLTQVEDE